MPPEVRRRRRPALSCVRCRQRKIQCDRQKPCAACTKNQLPCCYRDDSILDAFAQRDVASGQHEPLEHDASLNDGGHGLPTQSSRNDLLSHVDQARGDSLPIQGWHDSVQGFRAPRILQTPTVHLNKTRVTRWSLLMGQAPEFASIFSVFSKAFGHHDEPDPPDFALRARLQDISSLLTKCKHAARSLKLDQRIKMPLLPDIDSLLPTREVADRLVTSYFTYFETFYRILHAPTFWRQYQTFWQQPDAASVEIRLHIQLAIAIGSSVDSEMFADTGLRSMTRAWILAAQTWLAGPLEKDKLTFGRLQVYCLTLLAREVLAVGGDLVWISIGSLVNEGMQMGLHRDPKHLPEMSLMHSELRRRLWNTILEMLVQYSFDSGLPPRLSAEDFDTAPPADLFDEELENTVVSQAQTTPTQSPRSIQLVLFQSWPLRLQIAQSISGIKSELNFPEVLAVSSQLMDACRKQYVSLRDMKPASDAAFHRNMLDYLARRFLMPLLWPFAAQARTIPELWYALQLSLDTAMTMFSPEKNASFDRFMTIASGTFREGTRVAGTIICIQYIADKERRRLDGTLHRKIGNAEAIEQYVENLLAMSAERIAHGETNVKMHTFCAMILAYARAIETGVDSNLAVADAAISSLQLCLGLLESRAAPNQLSGVESELQYGDGLDFASADVDFSAFFTESPF